MVYRRWFNAVLVVASWALVAIPAVMLLSGHTQQIERWLVLATILPLLGLLSEHFAVSSRLDSRDRSLAENATQIALAEELAGVGRWSIDMSTLEHRWSEEVCRILGLPMGTAPEDGVLRTILKDGLQQIEITIRSHGTDREPYAIEFEAQHAEFGSRILRARARNDFSPKGELMQVFMMVRDVSEDYSLVATIERERQEALARADEAERLANTDPLTGLANRRRAMADLDRAILAARNSGKPLSLVVFDIDHFKEVNDRFGHPTGDKVLACVSAIAQAQAREGDVVARIGGEEFTWLVAGTDAVRAGEAAERLRIAIEVGTHSAPVPPVTASFGHATLEPRDTGLLLFARADEALYVAKRAGRNRVALAA